MLTRGEGSAFQKAVSKHRLAGYLFMLIFCRGRVVVGYENLHCTCACSLPQLAGRLNGPTLSWLS